MTIKEVINYYYASIDKFNTNNIPEITPEEFDIIINWSAERFVKTRYAEFEKTQKRMDDLRSVIRYKILTPLPTVLFINSLKYELPEDYWFSVMDQIKLSYLDCYKIKTMYTNPAEITHNVYMNIMNDPFNKPEKGNVLKIVSENFVYIIKDPLTSLDEYTLGYVSNNFKIKFNVNYDFNNYNVVEYPFSDSAVTEIIDIAVLKTLELFQEQRLSTFTQTTFSLTE